jgi:hypothetical protein
MATYNLSNIPNFNNILNETEYYNKYLKVINYDSNNTKYKIIQYNKDLLNFDLIDTYGLLRSVIINDTNKNVVCFSPPKSIHSDTFIKKHIKSSDNKNIIAEEFVEGTMINVFYDSLLKQWKIATKSTVDANVRFYKSTNKTFANMFMEACNKNNLVLSNLNPYYCYSFVLQHPENRIVLPIQQCALYLVAVYSIENNNNNVKIIEKDIEQIKGYGFFNNSFVKFPQKYQFNTYDELINKYASPNTPYNIVGVMIKNLETGERCKFRNPIYEEVKHLRGNQSKLQFQYLCLRQYGKVNEFLNFYPEMSKELSVYRQQLHLFTNTLFSNYISCYVKKEKPLKEFSRQYRSHMFKLHEKYINELMANKLFITKSVVINYVNNLPPALLMFSLNYNMRKHNIDNVLNKEN